MGKLNLILITFFLMLYFIGCRKAPKDNPWGDSLLYIPQSIVQSGGIDNNYIIDVNSSNMDDTSIVVGLYRSGLAPLESVTVDLSIDEDTLASAVAHTKEPEYPDIFDIYKDAKLLQPKFYSFSSNQITIENGERSAYTKINIDKKLLLLDPQFGSSVFVLPVKIENPTRYFLNEDRSLVMFIFKKR